MLTVWQPKSSSPSFPSNWLLSFPRYLPTQPCHLTLPPESPHPASRGLVIDTAKSETRSLSSVVQAPLMDWAGQPVVERGDVGRGYGMRVVARERTRVSMQEK